MGVYIVHIHEAIDSIFDGHQGSSPAGLVNRVQKILRAVGQGKLSTKKERNQPHF